MINDGIWRPRKRNVQWEFKEFCVKTIKGRFFETEEVFGFLYIYV